MKFAKIILALFVITAAVSLTGCVSQEQYESLQLKNRTQEERISELESELSSLRLRHQQMVDALEQSEKIGSVDSSSMREEIAALEKAIASKNALIEKMQKQLLSSATPLPMELNVMLTEFAAENSDMVSFDESTGMLKFKSDLLFASGSDVVQDQAVKALSSFAKIATASQAKDFDIVIAGHTDDVKIGKPSTKAKHPTNWHLSAHRAISVLKVLEKQGVASERMSARGFGEFRPVEPNKPNKKGNPANRRVEIYIVPKGM